jgi:hypothetical protein
MTPDEHRVDHRAGGDAEFTQAHRGTTMTNELLDVRGNDGELLGPMKAGPFLIGCVDEVNGQGAQEVSGYPLTRHELLILVRHWYEADLDNDIFCFLHQCSGSREIRIGPYASRRLARIKAILGEDAVQKVVDQVLAEMRKDLGAETWQIITEGTEEERDRLQEEVQQAFEYLHAKTSDAPTCQAAFAFLSAHPTELYFDSAGDLWYLGDSREPGQLTMWVRTRRRSNGEASEYRMARPPGWHAPYGLK